MQGGSAFAVSHTFSPGLPSTFDFFLRAECALSAIRPAEARTFAPAQPLLFPAPEQQSGFLACFTYLGAFGAPTLNLSLNCLEPLSLNGQSSEVAAAQ